MDLENKNINNLRILAIDMIENAKSGHPGIALGSAPILYSLYSKIMNVTPDDDKNIFRDRFVMSAGHGSSILYATLASFGYKISIEDLKNFRKLDSITPGHPEFNIVPGIDASTGPLGQGVAMAVGMAIAENMMASRFNKHDLTLFDNYTYSLVGEGCLMEGVSYEALCLAGTLKLNKLIVLYDCNKVTLDNSTNGVMDQNILAYFKSIGFNTLEVEDGNDVEQITKAILLAKTCKDKPSFIKVNTHIGFGSVFQDSNKAHGAVLGSENAKLLRDKLNIHTPPFEIDNSVKRDFALLSKRFDVFKKSCKEKLKIYSKAYPGDYKLLNSYLKNSFEKMEVAFDGLTIDKEMSGRDMGNIVLQNLCQTYPNIILGTADLSSSTKVKYSKSGFLFDNFANRNIAYGVREFGMGAITNGISLYGGFVPIDSTFLVFSDYMKSALRLRALMGLKSISIFTHDSIAVGEDGPTHEPCEQLWTLRSIPRTLTFRPANLSEIEASFRVALNSNLASNIVLSRQSMRLINSSIDDAKKGGYIISKEDKGELNGVIIATGTEIALAIDVSDKLKESGYNIRVVSMPCIELFERQSASYQNNIIPKNMKSIFSIEAGSTLGWHKFAGKFGKCYGVDDFGLSAKPNEIYDRFNLNVDYIAKDIMKIIKINRDKQISIV